MKIYTFHKNSSEIVQWLQENIGPTLHSQPIIFWHGRGWHMRSYYTTNLDNPNKNDHGWCIEVEDPKLAMLCGLRWI